MRNLQYKRDKRKPNAATYYRIPAATPFGLWIRQRASEIGSNPGHLATSNGYCRQFLSLYFGRAVRNPGEDKISDIAHLLEVSRKTVIEKLNYSKEFMSNATKEQYEDFLDSQPKKPIPPVRIKISPARKEILQSAPETIYQHRVRRARAAKETDGFTDYRGPMALTQFRLPAPVYDAIRLQITDDCTIGSVLRRAVELCAAVEKWPIDWEVKD